MEIGLAAWLVASVRPAKPMRWVMRVCSCYILVLVAGEIALNAFSTNCGCFGPGIKVGFGGHLLILGILLAWAASLERALVRQGPVGEVTQTRAQGL